MMVVWLFAWLAIGLAGWVGPAAAAESDSGLPLPRFVSLRAEEANIRTGPGEQYPIKWTYQRQGLPLEITAEFHHWRRVRDWQGTEGWMHSSMLSGRRAFIVVGSGEPVPIRTDPNTSAGVVAEVEPKVIGQIEECPKGGAWCRVKIERVKGWMERKAMWGTYPDEGVD